MLQGYSIQSRQHEEVATDWTYLSSKTLQGHKGGQLFCGVKLKKWKLFPLKKESRNVQALQDYIRNDGPPRTISSDNTKSETGSKWTEVLQEYMIKSKTSEPHHQHQNPTEPKWGRLS